VAVERGDRERDREREKLFGHGKVGQSHNIKFQRPAAGCKSRELWCSGINDTVWMYFHPNKFTYGASSTY
jgi:hypothetical protein